jgi:hypothetical protein
MGMTKRLKMGWTGTVLLLAALGVGLYLVQDRREPLRRETSTYLLQTLVEKDLVVPAGECRSVPFDWPHLLPMPTVGPEPELRMDETDDIDLSVTVEDGGKASIWVVSYDVRTPPTGRRPAAPPDNRLPDLGREGVRGPVRISGIVKQSPLNAVTVYNDSDDRPASVRLLLKRGYWQVQTH